MIKKFLFSVSAVVLMAFGTFEAGRYSIEAGQGLYQVARGKIRAHFAVSVPYEVEKIRYDEPALEQIVIDEAKASGVPKDLILAVMDVESDGGRNLSRFEPRKYANDNRAQTEFDRVMRNSSHGAMQVMGYNAAGCGMKWQDLYKPRQGIRCGVKILRDCLERAQGATANQRITAALGCYNGDPEKYPQKVKAALIDRLMSDGRVKLAMNFRNN